MVGAGLHSPELVGPAAGRSGDQPRRFQGVRPGPWAWLCIVYGILYLLIQAVLEHASPIRSAIGLLAFIPLSGATTIAFALAARSTGHPRYRRGFLCYSASFGVTTVGTIIWYVQGTILGQDPTFSWANLPYLLSYPLVIAGVLAFPSVRLDTAARWRLVLDGGIAVAAGAAITWLSVVLPLSQVDHSPAHRAILFAYPIGDLLSFAVIVPILLSGRVAVGGRALPLLAIGQMIYLAGDLGYQLGGGTPPWLRVDWPDVAYIFGYILLIWSAEAFRRTPATAEETDDGEAARSVSRNLVPLLLGLVVYALLLVAALKTSTPALSVLGVTAVIVTLLILVREALTERQNVRLARALAVERGEARFRNVIRHLRVGVVVQDAEARLRLANQAALDLLGLTEEELLGRTSFDPSWNVVRDDGSPLPGEEHPVPMAIATRRPLHNVVMGVFRPRTQDRVWLLVNAEPELRPDGEIEEVLCSFQDITELRTLEAQLRQSQRMEAVGQLAGGIAHDFNNLLTAITGYTALVQSSLDPDDVRREDVEEIRKAAARAAALTQQLLAFGRRQLLQPVVLEINSVVRDAERLLRRLLSEDIAIEMHLESDLGSVRVDRGQLEQVIINLAVNGRDAMPRGGSLTITTRTVEPGMPEIPPGFESCPEGVVILQVRDTGQGMDDATRARAFEPFFTTKEIGKGTGLGLSTVYGIIRQSGGDVWIQSEVGKGTTVTVCLPRISAPQAPSATPAPSSAPAGGHETVLLVEDEPALRRVIRRALESHGYAVLEAGAPEAARALLEASGDRIDLLVTDVVMPGGSGPDLAQWARSRMPDLPVLFITGHADEATMQYGLDLDNAALLPKPFRPEQLVTQVREALDRGR